MSLWLISASKVSYEPADQRAQASDRRWVWVLMSYGASFYFRSALDLPVHDSFLRSG